MKDGKFVLHHTKQLKGAAVYVYYMIAWYYRKNKKPFRNIIRNLGRLTDHEIEHYQNSIACLNNEPNIVPCNIDNLSVRISNEYLSCAVGIHFWDFWELSSVFKENSSKKEATTADIAKILTVMRMVQPCSKSFSAELYQETCLPQLTGVEPSLYNTSRIFRELKNIENHREELGKHIFNLAKKKRLTDGKILFYDLYSANIN